MDAPQVRTPNQIYEYYSREKYTIDTPGLSPDGPSTADPKQWGNASQQWESDGQQWATTQVHPEPQEDPSRVVDYSLPDGQTWGPYATGDPGQVSFVPEGTSSNSAGHNFNGEGPPTSPAAQIPYQYPYNEMGAVNGFSPVPLLPTGERAPTCFSPYCGLQRRDFWILIVIATLLAMGGIIGGVVGAVTINKNTMASAASNASGEGASPTPPGSDTSQSSLPVEDRSLAAASTIRRNSTESNYQIVYQDLETFDLVYQLIWDDKPAKKQNLTLQISPDRGTPLAMIATNSTIDDKINIFIFYTTCEDKSNAPLLAAVQLDCIPAALNCTVAQNFPIPATSDLGKESKLAALAMNDGTSLRVYYQTSNGNISVLRADTAANSHEWKSSTLGGPAVDGSKIAASVLETSSMLQVVFVCAEERLLQVVEYDDISGAQQGVLS